MRGLVDDDTIKMLEPFTQLIIDFPVCYERLVSLSTEKPFSVWSVAAHLWRNTSRA